MNLQDTIDKISQLQHTEEQLYNSLTTNAENVALGKNNIFTDSEIKGITDQINSLSAARVNLYNTLSEIYKSQSMNEDGAQKSMEQQTKTLQLLEQELNKSKENLTKLKDEKYNQLKMIEITTYYSKQYDAQRRLMRMIAIIGGCLLVAVALQYTPLQFLSAPLAILIGVIGGGFILYRIINMYLRGSTNYDEFIWPFAPVTDKELVGANATRIFDVSGVNLTPLCIGTTCCNDGTVWDDTLGCVMDKKFSKF